jgi:hypothetical protein
MLYCVYICVHTHLFFEIGTYIGVLPRAQLCAFPDCEFFNSSHPFWVSSLVFWDLLGSCDSLWHVASYRNHLS